MCNDFTKLFFGQLFTIGKSTGSVFTEAINIFRTFQRLSATKRFKIRLSKDCLKMFQWADDLIKLILFKLVSSKPFSDYELFSFDCFIIPAVVFTLFSAFDKDSQERLPILLSLNLLFLGFGIDYTINKSLAGIAMIIGAIILFCVILAFNVFFSFLNEDHGDIFDQVYITRAIFKACIALIGFMIPLCIYRHRVQIFLAVLTTLLIIVVFILEIISNCASCKCNFDLEDYVWKYFVFISDSLTLVIIPSANTFAEMSQTVTYHKSWQMYITFIFSLVVLVGLSIITTYLSLNEENDKYVNSRLFRIQYFRFLDTLDIIKQIVYAFCAAYDYPWACIGIEFAWIIIIMILIPYRKISEYVISIANSLVMFISNGVALYAESRGTVLFDYKDAIGFVICGCIPSIFALFSYFIFDFENKLDKNNVDFDEKLEKISTFSAYSLPGYFFVYGINILTLLGVKKK